jgi:hypothetical protein
MAKKKPTIIKDTPEDIMGDISLQNYIVNHVNAFGFENVIDNIVEGYRARARKFNKKADELEKKFGEKHD